ncbi:hypothetical protein GGF31_003761 [Allomyces arbusculus]|nr:hypothetical protein GGF31_003761 [Allomyces arbusculus]
MSTVATTGHRVSAPSTPVMAATTIAQRASAPSTPVMAATTIRHRASTPVMSPATNHRGSAPATPALSATTAIPASDICSITDSDVWTGTEDGTTLYDVDYESDTTVESIYDMYYVVPNKGLPGLPDSAQRSRHLEYRKIWKVVARVLTCFVPTSLLRWRGIKTKEEVIAWREKAAVFICVMSVYTLVGFLMIYLPWAQCVGKDEPSTFCSVFKWLSYSYSGLGGIFLLMSIVAALRTNWASTKYDDDPDAMLVMHIPCYSEDMYVLRKTIDSCVDSEYPTDRKVLFIVVDGVVKGSANSKPTHEILLQDVLFHQLDPEEPATDCLYSSASATGIANNAARVFSGFYRRVPYIVVVKTGLVAERTSAKPGNRGKRDSQLIVYKFFHYVNYSTYGTQLFVKIDRHFRRLGLRATDAKYMLVADADTKIAPDGLSILVDRMEKDPTLLGTCGETCVENKFDSFVAAGQTFEYWLTHAVLKAFEGFYSNVLVLSGCFTIYRLKFDDGTAAIIDARVLEDYSGAYQKTMHEHNLMTIGEDRYLSTLAIRYFAPKYKLQYFAAAKCTTTVPHTLSVLSSQRRRWTNSLIHCHLSLLANGPKQDTWLSRALLNMVMINELWMVFMLPLILPVGLFTSWWVLMGMLSSKVVLAITLAVFMLPCLLALMCAEFWMMLWWVPFTLMLPIFSVYIPLYSIWRMDDIKWGKTRV